MAPSHLIVFSLVLVSLTISANAIELQKLKPVVHTPNKTNELYKTIGIQGVIYCKSGDKLIPLQGAVAKIACIAKKQYRYESDPFTILSKGTDKKGYFLARLPISNMDSTKPILFKCKVFLHSSPSKTCNVPTDMNKGKTGALLYSSYHILHDNKMKLYSVGPFAYTSTKPY
ncbi:hypothetical protein ACHQM5_026474 [Ranunculus cassubicifolius]